MTTNDPGSSGQPKKRSARPLRALGVLGLIGIIAGCAGGGNDPQASDSSPGTGQVVQPEETGQPTPSATPSSTTKAPAKTPGRVGLCPANPPKNGPLTDQGEDVGRFGTSSYTYNSETDADKAGLCVAVLKVERVTFSQYASGAEDTGSHGIAVTVQIVNNDKRPYDLSATQVVVAAGAAGTELESVYDTDKGYEGGFSGSVSSKRRATGKYAFALAAPAELSVQVTPGFEFEEPAIFEGRPR